MTRREYIKTRKVEAFIVIGASILLGVVCAIAVLSAQEPVTTQEAVTSSWQAVAHETHHQKPPDIASVMP
jgi:hypothetical protein